MSEATEPKFLRQMTLADFEWVLPNEQASSTYLALHRWADGLCSPRCGHTRASETTACPWAVAMPEVRTKTELETRAANAERDAVAAELTLEQYRAPRN
jgi:hypothetical protein